MCDGRLSSIVQVQQLQMLYRRRCCSLHHDACLAHCGT